MAESLEDKFRNVTPEKSIEEWAIKAAASLTLFVGKDGFVADNADEIEDLLRELVVRQPMQLLMMSTVTATRAMGKVKELKGAGFTNDDIRQMTEAQAPDFPPDNL